MRWLICLCLLIPVVAATAQNNSSVSGYVIDEEDRPLSQVSISILGKNTGVYSNDSGRFEIKAPSGKAFALVFSYTGFISQQKNFLLSNGENEKIVIRLIRSGKTLETVIISDERDRKENSLIKINPKNAILLPSTTGGIEALIKTLVGSSNELTSQYTVRGGNYDENMIYVNDFEVYRPYLVSNGQQEGLSFINPELVRNVSFYTGGFQARYGDKMSSVLDIQYKKPTKFGGTAYISMLEQGLNLEGIAAKGTVSYLIGARNRNNRSLLSSQPTTGSYIPASNDLQASIQYRPGSKWQMEFLGIWSATRFSYYPESVKKTSAVFSPLFSANLGLDTYFEGQEKDRYSTSLLGASVVYAPTKKLKLKGMISRFKDDEEENYDISGAYLFGERDFDNSSSTFGQIVNPLGAGFYQQYARNKLDIEIWNATLRASFETGKHFFQWGNSIEQTKISDKLRQFEYQDSAGYSLPYQPGSLTLFSAINSSANLDIMKYSGFLQDNIHFKSAKNDISIQVGARYFYNNLNKEFLLSPRMQASWKPAWKTDIVFRAAAGLYHQPPFYRELRKYDGKLNTQVLAQRSTQFVAGMDYQFKAFDNLPFRISVEAYYKNMTAVNAYDVDNVRIRYFGNNEAKAYATGLEFRLFSELVKDAESWLTIGFMRTREDLNNDYYYDYLNAAGEVINGNSSDQVAADSIKNNIGYLRRPSDRLITVGLFLQDYLATNKNFKVHLNMIYGSNMPFNIPNNAKYRNALIIDPYIRVDIGFSALLLGEKNTRRSHSPFRGIENIWASLEIFNLINKTNTISYQLIKDFANNSYAIPNSLTPRLINFKVVARF
jgi:hypothetical protein